jgi:serine/threonine protein kinase
MAPEAAVGEFSPASDVYSVGITVLQMLMGRLPWEIGGDDNSFLMRLAREESLKPTVPDWIDSDLRELLIRCTARDPAQRPTAGELLESLVL